MPACKVMSRKWGCWAGAAADKHIPASSAARTTPRSGARMQPTARAVGELWSRDEPQRGERTVPHVKATILSLRSAQPPSVARPGRVGDPSPHDPPAPTHSRELPDARYCLLEDRKSTRLNSSHQIISYAVFCLKKK